MPRSATTPPIRIDLQAVGRDAAGRRQYRHHSDLGKVRRAPERPAGTLVAGSPETSLQRRRICRATPRPWNSPWSAVIELIARTAIRPGMNCALLSNGTRATMLLKFNVVLEDDRVVLTLKASVAGPFARNATAANWFALSAFCAACRQADVPEQGQFPQCRAVLHHPGQRLPARDCRHQDLPRTFVP